MEEELKRTIIIEHFSNPINKGKVEDSTYLTSNTNNESCIDNIDIYLKCVDGIIKDIHFDGEACAITTSSTSIMIKNLIGKSIEEANIFIDNFFKMINNEPYDEELLKEANCYSDIYKQQNRIKCATLPYQGIKKIIDEID